jgi:hypothetical protein
MAMNTNRLSFLDDGQSIASTVSQLHHYFKQAHSRYTIKQSELINRVHGEPTTEQLQQDLQQIEEATALFGVLMDSLSVANRILHSTAIAQLIGTESEVYQIHLESEAEQTAEREVAERKPVNA